MTEIDAMATLSKDELPCIVEGCDWCGKSLSMHVNLVYGITAVKFKELDLLMVNHHSDAFKAIQAKASVAGHAARRSKTSS